MRALIFALILPLASPALAEEGQADLDAGPSLVEQGARLILRGLMAEMEPALKDMAEGVEEFAREVEPMLRDLVRMMEDFRNYHPPIRLPNGDILIRRRQPGEVLPGEDIEI